ncbi:MAG: mechanosensitive ion channel domain-containing protein [Planctomycetota bacterium]
MSTTVHSDFRVDVSDWFLLGESKDSQEPCHVETNPMDEEAAPETASGDPGLVEQTSDVVTSITEGDWDAVKPYLVETLVPALINAGLGLLVIFLGYLIGKYIARIVSNPIRRKVDETLGRFIGQMTFYAIFGGVTIAVLSKLGAPLGGLAAILAAMGFAVGLAFQGTLSNFAAGVLMMVFRPFKVGDFINAGGVAGVVNEIDLFTTKIDTPDNRRIIVPNSSISGGTIENVSFHDHRRVEVAVGVGYNANLDQTRSTLQAALDEFAELTISGDGRGNQVVLAELGDSAVVWKCRIWVQASDFWPIQEGLTEAIKRQLDAVDISIPFPQLDVHLSKDDDEEPNRTRRPQRRDDFPQAS